MGLAYTTDKVAFFDGTTLKKETASTFADRASSDTIKLLVKDGDALKLKAWSAVHGTDGGSTKFLVFRGNDPKIANLADLLVAQELQPDFEDIEQFVHHKNFPAGGAIRYSDGTIATFNEYPSSSAQSLMGQGHLHDWDASTSSHPDDAGVYHRTDLTSLQSGGELFVGGGAFAHLKHNALYMWGYDANDKWGASVGSVGTPVETGISDFQFFSNAVAYIKSGVGYVRGTSTLFRDYGFGGNATGTYATLSSTPKQLAISNPTKILLNTNYYSYPHFAISGGNLYAAGKTSSVTWGTNSADVWDDAGSADRTGTASSGYIKKFMPVGGLSGRIIKVISNGTTFAVRNSAGDIFAWGSNAAGLVGRDHDYFNDRGETGFGIVTPRAIKTGDIDTTLQDLPACRDICLMSGSVMLAVDNNGNVWGWGRHSNINPNSTTETVLSGITATSGNSWLYGTNKQLLPTKLTYFPDNVESITQDASYSSLVVKTTDDKIFSVTTDLGFAASGGRYNADPQRLFPNSKYYLLRV